MPIISSPPPCPPPSMSREALLPPVFTKVEIFPSFISFGFIHGFFSSWHCICSSFVIKILPTRKAKMRNSTSILNNKPRVFAIEVRLRLRRKLPYSTYPRNCFATSSPCSKHRICGSFVALTNRLCCVCIESARLHSPTPTRELP